VFDYPAVTTADAFARRVRGGSIEVRVAIEHEQIARTLVDPAAA
jgi:hypothetical protein